MIVITLASVLTVIPLSAVAESETVESGTTILGNKIGRFMSSFMDGLDSKSAKKEISAPELIPKPELEKKVHRSGKLQWQGGAKNTYDPWGATALRGRRYPAYRYDPWGVTNQTGDLRRFADQDWAYGRRYYGAGVRPYFDRPYNNPGYGYYGAGPDQWGGSGYGLDPNTGYLGSQSGWDRSSERNWPTAPNGGYPYDLNEYDRPGWNNW